jgi:hypothetical protein
VVFTDRLGLFLTRAPFAAFATISSAAVTSLATVTAWLVTLFGALTTWLMFTRRVMGPLVSVNRGRMIVRMGRGSGLRVRFFAFSKAKHLFQAGFDAAEERGLFGGVVGASRRGHKQ